MDGTTSTHARAHRGAGRQSAAAMMGELTATQLEQMRLLRHWMAEAYARAEAAHGHQLISAEALWRAGHSAYHLLRMGTVEYDRAGGIRIHGLRVALDSNMEEPVVALVLPLEAYDTESGTSSPW